ncbi:MAG: hypothetical protein ACKOYQ_05545, partial [Actinomycetota bacterium]
MPITISDLLHDAVPYALPLQHRFRGITVREGVLLRGPSGWGEFAPFDDYSPRDLYRRRSLAWRTMGLLAPDESIRRDIATYFATGVIGYY